MSQGSIVMGLMFHAILRAPTQIHIPLELTRKPGRQPRVGEGERLLQDMVRSIVQQSFLVLVSQHTLKVFLGSYQ